MNTKNGPSQQDIDAYLADFHKEWTAHMANGGGKENGVQLRQARHELYAKLNKRHPQVGRYVEASRVFYRELAKGSSGFGKPKRKMSQDERLGVSIVTRLGKEPPRDLAWERYQECARAMGELPGDAIACILLGVKHHELTAYKTRLAEEYIISEPDTHDEHFSGYRVERKPKPLTLAERIEKALAAMKQEDQEAIAQLLEESVN